LSLKENIDMVKDELNSEEKFFENAVKAERVWKKYKGMVIGAVAVVAAIVIIDAIYEAKQESAALDSNVAYAKLLKGSDAQAEKELATLNPELLNAWKFSSAVATSDVKALEMLASSSDAIISDLAKYELAAISADSAKLQSYTASQHAIYKDLAMVESALLLMKEGKTEQAHQKLSLVSESSSMYKVARSLMHYGVK
jgi:hypothetical protein